MVQLLYWVFRVAFDLFSPAFQFVIDSKMMPEAENARLRSELQALHERYDALFERTSDRIQRLEDENEVLAEANRLLLENNATSQRLQGIVSEKTAGMLQVPDELLVPGAGLTTRQVQVVTETHAFGNLLSVALHVSRPEIVLTGGADKLICVHDWCQKLKLCEFAASAPVLDLAFNPAVQYADFFVATFMDGKHGLYRLARSGGAEAGWAIEEIRLFHEHTRPGAIKTAWSACGTLFATGASDKALHIFQCTHLNGNTGGDDGVTTATCEKLNSFYFNGTVEALTFIPATTSITANGYEELESEQEKPRNELLAIAVRDDCYVHYVDCATFEKERYVVSIGWMDGRSSPVGLFIRSNLHLWYLGPCNRVNMNQDDIEHVSYTIMDLRVSPSGKYLLAATDSSRHFIIAVRLCTYTPSISFGYLQSLTI